MEKLLELISEFEQAVAVEAYESAEGYGDSVQEAEQDLAEARQALMSFIESSVQVVDWLND